MIDCTDPPLKARRARSWVTRADRYLPGVIIDQHLLQAGYTIHFAIDFNELRSFLHPFRTDPQQQPDSWDDILPRILACAFLMYQEGKRPHLAKPILLSPYVDELLEHFYQLRRQSLPIAIERERLVALVDALLTDPAVQACITDIDTLKDDAFAERMLPVLLTRFSDLARLWYIQEVNYRYEQPDEILTLDINRYFECIEYETLAADVPDETVHALATQIYAHRHERLRESNDPDIRTTRDARALIALSELNRRARLSGKKDLHYLLTSTPAIGALVSDSLPEQRRLAATLHCPLLEPVYLGRDEEQCTSVSMIRHPFQIVLFLCHLPPPANERTLRRDLINRLQSARLRAALAARQLEDIDRFYQQSCCGTRDRCQMLQVCTDHERLADAIGSEVGSWTNVSSSLERNHLLPAFLQPSKFIEDLHDFLLQLRDEGKRAQYIDVLLAGNKETISKRLASAVIDVAIQAALQRIESEDPQTAFKGRLESFPYRVTFVDEAVRSAIERCAAFRQSKDPGAPEQFRQSIRVLLGILASEWQPEQEEDRYCLTAVFLILLGDLRRLKVFVEARGDGGSSLRGDWPFVRARTMYMSLRALEQWDDNIAGRLSRQLEKLARTGDPRVENLRGLTLVMLGDQRSDPACVREAIVAFERLLQRDREVLLQAGPDFHDAVVNNLVMANTEMGLLTRDDNYLVAAFELGATLSGLDIDVDVKDTVGQASVAYGLSDIPSRREALEQGVALLDFVLDVDARQPVYPTAHDRAKAKHLLARGRTELSTGGKEVA